MASEVHKNKDLVPVEQGLGSHERALFIYIYIFVFSTYISIYTYTGRSIPYPAAHRAGLCCVVAVRTEPRTVSLPCDHVPTAC